MNPVEYETMFRVEDTHWWYQNLHALLETALQRFLAPAANPACLLDIGCGTGAALQRLQPLGTAHGLDISTEAIACCRRRGLDRLCRASALDLPYATGSFDAAVLFDVFCHRQVPDAMLPLREAHRVLRPGGVAIANVPAYQWLYSSHDEAVHTARRFTRKEVLALLREAGFEIAYASHWNTLLFPPIVAVRLARRWLAPAESDLEGARDGLVNKLLNALLGCERRLMQRTPLPFGLSIFVVARKPAAAPYSS